MRIMFGLAGAALLATFATPAAAQLSCTEGAIGQVCVSPQLAERAREGAVARTQTRLSISNHNYPPSQDWQTAYPNNVSGAPQYTSGRVETPAKAKFHSIPYILYGVPN